MDDTASTGSAMLDVLIEQLEWHWTNQLRPRLDGLTDDEYLWEPVAGAWSVRPGAGGDGPTSPFAVNPAAPTTIDFAFPEPNSAGITIAQAGARHRRLPGARLANHFGGSAVDYGTFPYFLTAGALAQLDEACRGLTSCHDDAALARPVGPTEGPGGVFDGHAHRAHPPRDHPPRRGSRPAARLPANRGTL